MITVYNILITVSVYLVVRILAKKFSSPLISPVFFSTIIIIILLFVSHVSFKEYLPAKKIMTYLLGPATVALAVPIYKNKHLFKKYFAAALLGLTIGMITTLTSALLLAKCFQLAKIYVIALTVKSVTVPVAVEIGAIIRGNSSLIVAFVIITGMIGAVFGAKIMSLFKITHPFARGLAIGTISHGIGTVEAVKEGEVQGAVSGAIMGLTAVLTAFIIPYFIHYII